MSLTDIGNGENSESVQNLVKLNNEIEELNESLRLERRKYYEWSIIREVAMSCTTEESDLPPELQSKLLNILSAPDIEECLEMLGISPVNIELRYEEKQQIKDAIQQGIMNKSRRLFEELDELGIGYGKVSDDTRSILNCNIEDKVLMDHKKQLNEKQSVYVSQLEELISILQEIVNLKTETVPKSVDKKIHSCEIQLQLCQLQAQVVDSKVRVDVFTESSVSLEAYRRLLKDISQQQVDCKQEIQQLKELKEQYANVSCKQYSEILQSYIKYKTNIEHKKEILHRLKAK